MNGFYLFRETYVSYSCWISPDGKICKVKSHKDFALQSFECSEESLIKRGWIKCSENNVGVVIMSSTLKINQSQIDALFNITGQVFE